MKKPYFGLTELCLPISSQKPLAMSATTILKVNSFQLNILESEGCPWRLQEFSECLEIQRWRLLLAPTPLPPSLYTIYRKLNWVQKMVLFSGRSRRKGL